MNDNKGQTIFLSVIGIATLLVAIIGATFAYFTTTMNAADGNNGNVNATTAKLGTTTYKATPITGSNILPGWSGTGSVTVSMEASDYDVDYTCYLNTSVAGKTEGETETAFNNMYVTSTSTAEGITGLLTKEKIVKTTSGAKGQQIAAGTLKASATAQSQVINYTILFEEINSQQNVEQGMTLTSVVSCELAADGEAGNKYTHTTSGE